MKNGVSNKRIAILINKHCINFDLSDEYISNLRELGANNDVITTLRNTCIKKNIDAGSIYVNSFPMDAEITINGLYRGNTPRRLDDVLPGKVDVRIGKVQGYEDFFKTVEVKPHETVTVEVTLKKISDYPDSPKYPIEKMDSDEKLEASTEIVAKSTDKNELKKNGYIKIESEPSGAKVYVDGNYKELTPVAIMLLKGKHSLVLIKENYDVSFITLEIKEGINLPLMERLRPK